MRAPPAAPLEGSDSWVCVVVRRLGTWFPPETQCHPRVPSGTTRAPTYVTDAISRLVTSDNTEKIRSHDFIMAKSQSAGAQSGAGLPARSLCRWTLLTTHVLKDPVLLLGGGKGVTRGGGRGGGVVVEGGALARVGARHSPSPVTCASTREPYMMTNT